jgi:two-component system response regulator (stage 0 sporulation protein A)
VEVINVLQKEEVEVLILDLIMPYMDGIGVLEKINSMNLEKRPRVIILTAFGQENITQKAVQNDPSISFRQRNQRQSLS